MNSSNKIQVEVAFATPTKQSLLSLKVSSEATVVNAIKASGILDIHPEINLELNQIGIWSKKCELDTPLKNQDRIEIYRDIASDPMEARRKRAVKD